MTLAVRAWRQPRKRGEKKNSGAEKNKADLFFLRSYFLSCIGGPPPSLAGSGRPDPASGGGEIISKSLNFWRALSQG